MTSQPPSESIQARAVEPTPARRVAAWGVHLFTASGAVIGVVALLSAASSDFGRAAVCMLVSLFIDSFDGTLARRVGVARVLPDIDGRRLDDIVDFLNFAVVPVAFMVWAGSLPGWAWTVLPVLASAYGFSQREAKTQDDFFLGWPSYWNVLALYLWLLDLSPQAGAAWATGCAIAVFVPIRYVYPSKLRVLRRTTIALGLAWGALIGTAVLATDPALRGLLTRLSLGYVVYYLALSLWLGGLRRSPKRA